MILPNVITYPGIVFALVARIAIPYLTGTPHFDDVPSLSGGTLADMPTWVVSFVGGAYRRTNRRRFALVDGLDVGKTSRHRGDGSRRREDDVYGRRLSRLAAYDPNDLRGSLEWFSYRCCS